ncbi:pilus assembly protein [Ectothiorhodospira mobilis]|uniref:pilus assembly protein n=1 Tax=Ectothiorhodospira mobilis TaxID=195064 RepID=UPI001EE7D6BE|nr:PilC/PilY family type IV pilus protein [Ectothiorhodospira mobilis]MCG5534645.1 hypothetical protein [Ectothiorhodospira mobilis]
MLMRRVYRIGALWTSAFLLSAAIAGTAVAAPGPLAQVPLDSGTSVPPNILFVLDDSGSMDWDHMPTDRARELYPYATDEWVYIDPTPSEAEEWRELCTAYNAMAYDPSVEYVPWSGWDQDRDRFEDVPVDAAPFNPYWSSSDTVNLEERACQEGNLEGEYVSGCWWSDVGFFYVRWVDDNGNGQYDELECIPPRDQIPTDGNYFPYNVPAGGKAEIVYVKEMTDVEKQNYANWFSYYRKKEYVAKAAMSALIYDSAERMGLRTLNNNHDVNTPVLDIDDRTMPVDEQAADNKRDLLAELFQNSSDGGTPLRTELKEAGRYFEGDSSEWQSPILPQSEGGSCQQNFTILMTDGYWNGGSPYVGNADGDQNTDFDGGSHADDYSNTLADVAMHFYERDLSPLPDLVPTSDADPAAHQHMVTFTVSFGVNGELDENPSDRTTAFDWPQPVPDGVTTIDDLRHAAWNGRGDYLSARNPQSLISGLRDAYQTAVDRSATAAAGAFNGQILKSGTRVYVPLYNTDDWSGDLLAIQIDPATGAYAETPDWSAAEQLDGRNLTTAPRNILSYDGTQGVAFQWDLLSSDMQRDLQTQADGTQGSDDRGREVLAYLRGERDQEQENDGPFRDRGSRLGDIVHSAPVYVGEPELDWPDEAPFPEAEGSRYADFRDSSSRDAMIYVGGNDGMLHGFDADTGSEVMAYVPHALVDDSSSEGLHYLSDPDYTHRFYVDLSPTVSDVYLENGGWRTLLVGGLRAGGRGLFALDITDPSDIGASDVLWEFSSEDDADLGYTFSQPTVAMLNNGEWAVIFGNGYNHDGSGSAQLFILFIEEGLDGSWDTKDYLKIDTGAGSLEDVNGLATPVVADVNGDSVVDRVYAGDLEGNLWAFDLSDGNSNQWGVAYTSGNQPVPLFTAVSAEGNPQPITTRPSLIFNTQVGSTEENSPNILVTFGTGQYLVMGDRNTQDVQSYYGVWDAGSGDVGRSQLVEQTFVDWTDADTRVLTRNPVDYDTGSGGDRGWFFDLPATGERVFTDTMVRNQVGYFATRVPNDDPCMQGGQSWLMIVDLLTGGRPEEPAIDIDNNDVVDEEDQVEHEDADHPVAGLRIDKPVSDLGAVGNRLYLFGGNARDDTSYAIPPHGGENTGRMSWREILR